MNCEATWALCCRNASIDLNPDYACRLDVFGDASSACQSLAAKEPTLARALQPIRAPHIRRREGGFKGLFRIIVEQQVSAPSARAIWGRCEAALETAAPSAVIDGGADGLKALGLSGPKARYVLALAREVEDGRLDLAGLAALDDEAASAALQSVTGIGPWSAAIYLLFCEGRVDIWPPNDVALKAAYNAAKPRRPYLDQKSLDARSLRWAPYRGVAAHILWTWYAHLRGRTPV